MASTIVIIEWCVCICLFIHILVRARVWSMVVDVGVGGSVDDSVGMGGGVGWLLQTRIRIRLYVS